MSDIVKTAMMGNLQIGQQFGSAFETGMKIAQAAEQAKMENAIKQEQLNLQKQQMANTVGEKTYAGLKFITDEKTPLGIKFEAIGELNRQRSSVGLAPFSDSIMKGIIQDKANYPIFQQYFELDRITSDPNHPLNNDPKIKEKKQQIENYLTTGGFSDIPTLIRMTQDYNKTYFDSMKSATQGRGLENTMQRQQDARFQEITKRARDLGVQIPESLDVPALGAGMSPKQMEDFRSLQTSVTEEERLAGAKDLITKAREVAEKVRAPQQDIEFIDSLVGGKLPKTPENINRAKIISNKIISADKRQEFVISERDKKFSREDVIYKDAATLNDKFSESKQQLTALKDLLSEAKKGNAVAGNMLYGPLQSLLEGRNSVVRDPELARLLGSQGLIEKGAQILPILQTGEKASPEIIRQVDDIITQLEPGMKRAYTSRMKPIVNRAKGSGIKESSFIADELKDLYVSGQQEIKKSKEQRPDDKVINSFKSILAREPDRAIKAKLIQEFNNKSKVGKIGPELKKELLGVK